MQAVIIVSYVVNAICIVAAVASPAASYLAIDKQKYFWVGLLIACGLFGPVGLVADLVFLVALLPRLLGAGAGTSRSTDQFLKQ